MKILKFHEKLLEASPSISLTWSRTHTCIVWQGIIQERPVTSLVDMNGNTVVPRIEGHRYIGKWELYHNSVLYRLVLLFVLWCHLCIIIFWMTGFEICFSTIYKEVFILWGCTLFCVYLIPAINVLFNINTQ